MYLSRLLLNRRSRAVRRDLADCHQMHRTVLSAFPQVETAIGAAPRATLRVLYRIETFLDGPDPQLLVQSEALPDWSQLPPGYLLPSAPGRPNPVIKPITEAYQGLTEGRQLRFRLLANPTRKIDTKSGPDGRRRHGRRVELRNEDAQLEWLARKAGQCGFELTSVRARPGVANVAARSPQKVIGRRPRDTSGDTPLTFGTVLFEGELRVVDAERFRRALVEGVGSGKAYGCGLLSVGPARA